MTVIHQDLNDFLQNSTAVTAYTTGIHCNRVPQEISNGTTTPHVWYQRAADESGDWDLFLDGSADGLRKARFDFECFALDNPGVAIALADAIKTRLHGYRGTIAATSTGGVRSKSHGIFVESKDDQYVPRILDVDEGFDVVALDVLVLYST